MFWAFGIMMNFVSNIYPQTHFESTDITFINFGLQIPSRLSPVHKYATTLIFQTSEKLPLICQMSENSGTTNRTYAYCSS